MQVELEDRTVTLDIQADMALNDEALDADMCVLAQETEFVHGFANHTAKWGDLRGKTHLFWLYRIIQRLDAERVTNKKQFLVGEVEISKRKYPVELR